MGPCSVVPCGVGQWRTIEMDQFGHRCSGKIRTETGTLIKCFGLRGVIGVLFSFFLFICLAYKLVVEVGKALQAPWKFHSDVPRLWPQLTSSTASGGNLRDARGPGRCAMCSSAALGKPLFWTHDWRKWRKEGSCQKFESCLMI